METLGNEAGEAASEETRDDVGGHRFWRRGTAALFDVRIFNLDAGSYLLMRSEKDIAKAEKEKK